MSIIDNILAKNDLGYIQKKIAKNLLKIARHFNELELFNDLFQEEKYRSLSQLRKAK